ncbi:glycosyltransferase family 39 protein [Aphanothece sacrum]|uniref:Glycosyltransferase RgtA/B/C/D-like domain-containing protein n=1 Tax=Aphanothece sacrum FPU1 TaxID=1920663 RepID=A0A401IEW0_APHSA|nr:hypothetical protein [Aphanothece sacrum]GBF79771.1 hypothetical protein AsFPU1_1170 [Aphanothece sacrum FPU1]GBF84783.1 hypothetical protein AsFPU3_1837 [Aphanothece sacrum FPU3]
MKTSIKIAIISLLWLIVINSGTLGVLDTELRLDMSHAWWTGTQEIKIPLDTPAKIRGDIRFGVIGIDGKRYIAYEQGQSMLMLPGDWVGTQLYNLFPIMEEEKWREFAVSFLIFIPLNIALVLSIYWFLKLFEFPDKISGLASLTCLLGTTILHYAQVHQQNNQVLLCVTLGYAAAFAYVQSKNYRWLFISGLVLGGSILIRITSPIHVFTVGLFLVGSLIYQTRGQELLKLVKPLIIWTIGLIPLTLVGRISDYLRYGGFFLSGKKVEKLQLATDPLWKGMPQLPANYPLINEPYVGVIGPFISPAKSIFIYDPFLLPCLLLAINYWKRLSFYLQWYLLTAGLNLLLHLFAYSKFYFWHSDHAWAARYHVTSVHLLLIPLLGIFYQDLLLSKPLKKWLMKGIIIIALLVNFSSVAMPFNLEIYQTQIGFPGSRLDFRLSQRITNIACKFNSSISNRCIANHPKDQKTLEEFNKFSFFPFVFQQEAKNNPQLDDIVWFLFLVWILALFLAIFMTFKFFWCFLN